MGFSSDDRAIIETAFDLEVADEILSRPAHHGSWSSRVMAIRDTISETMEEIREYLLDLEDADD